MNDETKLKKIIEGLLLAAGKPLSLEQMANIFMEEERPDNEALREVLKSIEEDCEGHGFQLTRVASGYRFQVREEVSDWIGRLWEEKPQKYSRALMETLAIIAYRQPLTRGDIEKIRGVAVSTTIMRTLMDREWIRVVGHRDVPGRPAMYASTRQFLDYFNLESLQQLPPLSEIRDMEDANKDLALEEESPTANMRVLDLPDEESGNGGDAEGESGAGETDDVVHETGDGEDRAARASLPEADEETLAWATRPLEEIIADPDADDSEENEADDEEGYENEDENEDSRSESS